MNTHIAFGQDTVEKVDALMRSMDVETLLRAAYSLTHTLHRLDAVANDRVLGRTTQGNDARTEGANVRAQRDLIDAEIARRCER